MKKIICSVLALAMLFALCSCDIYSDTHGSDALSETIMQATQYEKLVSLTGKVAVNYTMEYFGDDAPINHSGSVIIVNNNGTHSVNITTDYVNGQFTHAFYSDKADDNNVYEQNEEGFKSYQGAKASVENLLKESAFGYEFYFCQSARNDDGTITIKYYDPTTKTLLGEDTLTVSEENGEMTVLAARCERFEEDKTVQKQSVTFDYSESVVNDFSPMNAG